MKNAIGNKNSRETLTSANLDKTLEAFKTEVKNFREQQLSRGNQKETVEEALNEIETTLTEISQKVIDPLKNDFTETSIENLQKKLEQLGFFPSQQEYGTYGPKTYKAIDDFFQAKQKNLEEKLQIIKSNVNPNASAPNLQELSDRATQLELELETEKAKAIGIANRVAQLEKEKTIAVGIAVLAFLVSGISFLRSLKGIDRRSPKASRSKNIRNKPDIKTIFPQLNIPLFGKNQNQQSETPGVENTEIQADVPKDIRLDIQSYNHLYNEIYNELDQEFSQKLQKIKRSIESIESKVTDLENRTQKTTKSQSRNYQPPQIEEEKEQARISPWSSYPEPVSTPPARSVPTFSNPQWVDTYNRQSPSLSLTEVSPTEESLNNRRLGSSQPIILETSRRGHYGIYIDGNEHYLVPSQHFRINQHNYKTVEALFECRNYTPDSPGNFRLLKPAVAYPITGGKSWQLYEPGILQF
ncbi:hypothetical protein V0288_04790 [Pannus brasiliensis CCIBt3594]|uniref:Peptidoglycan binding-like domain-containing protein n=1 Tax=Pannus brasiliensis CCIBt3594 TaxID=1427578 RepID=A0AAW9QSH1_9CHRO